METKDFRTKTIFQDRKNISVNDVWEIALDIGYSAVKVFAPNGYYSFPSFALKMEEGQEKIGQTNYSDILYKDLNTGEIWSVGALAQDVMRTEDTTESMNTLYTRYRYTSKIFEVITSVGLGMGLMNNKFGISDGKDIIVQTGLPSKYKKADTNDLICAIAKKYNFALKVGNKDWINFNFEVKNSNVFVMEQPKGTLLSISTDNNGKIIPETKEYLSSTLLIMDPGFGTLDTFNIVSGMLDNDETFPDLGMKEVLRETSDEIFNKYNREIPVPAMQKYLETGKINYFNKELMKSDYYNFEEILQKANENVCSNAIEKIKSTYNYLMNHNYLVITGGTGAAWYNQIKNHFKDMNTLKIIAGNQNDNIPFIFSNVRGYYMAMYNKLIKRNGK